MRATTRQWAGILVVLGLGTVGCQGADPTCSYPAAPAGASSVVHVCAGASGDGTNAASARGSLAAAVDAAPAGAVILVGQGTYRENVVIRRPITIIGGELADEGAGASVELTAPGPNALVVEGATGVVVQGLRIVGAETSGVWLMSGSEATLEGLQVEGTHGFGVLATKASLTLRRSAVSNSSDVGVLLWDGSSGIIDTNNLTANLGGGLRIDDSTAPDFEPNITHNVVSDNGQFGVGVFGSVAIIDTNNITATTEGAVGGYGILAASYDGDSPSSVTVSGNTIDGSARAGIVLTLGTKAIIDTNNINGNGATGKSGAGVWLAAGADATLTNNTLAKNNFAGVALVGEATAIIDTNNITGVPGGSLAVTVIGDGLFLGPGSSSTVKNNTVSSCYRAGVFTDGASASTKLVGNTLSGNDYAMILQGQGYLDLDGNSASMNVKSNGVDLTSAAVPAGKFGTLGGAIDVPAEVAVAGAAQ